MQPPRLPRAGLRCLPLPMGTQQLCRLWSGLGLLLAVQVCVRSQLLLPAWALPGDKLIKSVPLS